MNFSYDGPEMLYVFPEVLSLFESHSRCLVCLSLVLRIRQPTRVSTFRLRICMEYRQSITRQSQGLECTSRWATLKAAPCLSKDHDWRIPWQMETFTQQEENQNDGCEKSKSGSDTDVEADVEAKGSLWFYLTPKMQMQRCCHPETQSCWTTWFYVVRNTKVVLSTICELVVLGPDNHHLALFMWMTILSSISIFTWHSFQCNLASVSVQNELPEQQLSFT